MPRAYASQFTSMVVEEVRAGRRVAEVAASVEVPEATVYRWVRQDRIDRGELIGTSTVETAELRAARQRIAELEVELATVKRASKLFAEGRVVRPQALFGIVETLAREGHGTKRVCRLVRVAASGFFRWRNKPPSDRAIRRAWLTDVIGEIHEQSRRTSASPGRSASDAVSVSTVPLHDGRSVSVESNGNVTVYRADGSLDGESQCAGNGFDYAAAVSLLNRFQSAVRRHDVAAVVALVDIPMRAGDKLIVSDAALRDQFDQIFNINAMTAIEAPDPRGLFCRSDGFMMGDGVVWGTVDASGVYRVQSLNPAT